MAAQLRDDETQAVAVQQGEQGIKPLLALRTYVPERPSVDIDGESYEIHLLSEFGAVRRQRVINTWSRAVEILRRVSEDDETVTPEEERLVDHAYIRVIEAAIPDMPRAVARKLNTMQREELVALFFRLTAETDDPTLSDLLEPGDRPPTGG